MNLKAAIYELRRFQDWRRGYDCRAMKDAGIEPEKLGKAIDKILAHHGMAKPLRNCEQCGEYNAMFGQCGLIGSGEKCEKATDVYGTLGTRRGKK